MEIFADPRTPLCGRAETATCPAPCAGRCSRRDYDQRVAEVRAFLEVRGRQPLKELERSLEDASARLDFERAATLRDRLARLRRLRRRLSAFGGQLRSMNLIYPAAGRRSEDRVYLIRRGRLHSEWPAPASASARQHLADVVTRAFRPVAEDRHAAMSADAASEVLLTAGWFARRPEERRRAVGPCGCVRGRASTSIVRPRPIRPARGSRRRGSSGRRPTARRGCRRRASRGRRTDRACWRPRSGPSRPCPR